MSENLNETEESNKDVSLEEPEGTLSLKEVLDLEDELVEESAALLGAANDKNCSYGDGYIKRQALYSCITCIPDVKDDPEKGAGICLACSYHCHEGHELVELYTKRNFQCDCGNRKFSNVECTLHSEKSATNELNSYNQNFSGLYCVCHRPYPDMEDPIPDEMIQCIICEDWYHTRHLGTEFPTANFAEMICEGCVTKHEFLLHYDEFALNKATNTTENNENVDVESSSETNKSDIATSSTSYCKKPKQKSSKVTAKFWSEVSWRKQLCACDDCLKLYENENVAFLLDPEDPVCLYEEKSKAKAKEIADNQDSEFMKSMDRVQLMDCIVGYNDLKERLGDYLKKFAENKKIVREEDIREFFDGMYARKRQRVEVPKFCR